MKKFLMVSLIAGSIVSGVSYAKEIYSPDFLNIIKSKHLEGKVNSRIIFLADQLERNLSASFKHMPIIVTTFSNLDDLDKTNPLGRIIAENLQHELQVRKWKVIDVRLAKSIYINKEGEFILSRDLEKLKNKNVNVGGILTGTYSFLGDYIIINAKVIRLSDGVILSSGQIILPADDLDFELYEGETASISIEGD